jgi:hypothetical protein
MGRGIKETRTNTSNANIVQIVKDGVKVSNYASISLFVNGASMPLSEAVNPYDVPLYGHDMLTDQFDPTNPSMVISISIPSFFSGKKAYISFCTYAYGYNNSACIKTLEGTESEVSNSQNAQNVGSPFFYVRPSGSAITIRVMSDNLQSGLTLGRLLIGIKDFYIAM